MTITRELHVTTPSDTEIAMTRTFDAPRPLVYEAFTKPELVRRWLGAVAGYTMVQCEIDLRVGGAYRYVWRGPDGGRMGMAGVYREVVPVERIVSTEKFEEAWYEGEAVGTALFEEDSGRTVVTTTVRYASREARDGVLRSPMASGVSTGYQALDDVLLTLTAADS